jgi:hypothetical protein
MIFSTRHPQAASFENVFFYFLSMAMTAGAFSGSCDYRGVVDQANKKRYYRRDLR